MGVICITILKSANVVAGLRQPTDEGIPQFVTLTTNIPSTIFYTLDGSEPTTSSSVYALPITMPTDLPSVVLKVFATNGLDISPVICQTYGPDLIGARLPHAAVVGQGDQGKDLGPFGSGQGTPAHNGKYINPSHSGITTQPAGVPIRGTGFDAFGKPNAGTRLPLEKYDLIKSTTNQEGETGPGIGTLPVVIDKIPSPAYGPESTVKANNALFNPRALVIFQDATTDNPANSLAPMINREFFSLENPEIVRDGSLLSNVAPNGPTTMGSFVRAGYNSSDNTVTYYFYDNSVNRWIISKQPYVNRDPNAGELYSMVFGRGTGIGKVFQWHLFSRRVLF
jgi:hypothetical protein